MKCQRILEYILSINKIETNYSIYKNRIPKINLYSLKSYIREETGFKK